ncbi:MAG: amidase domain-containing protein [Candidatus Pristimantibacillus sp.]
MSSRMVKQGTGGRAEKQAQQPLLNTTSQLRQGQQPQQAHSPSKAKQAKSPDNPPAAKQQKRVSISTSEQPQVKQQSETKKSEIKQQAAVSSRHQELKLTSLLRSSDYIPAKRDEPEGWKSALHQYVSRYNKAETEQHVAVIDDYITDKDHCSRLRGRLERLRERDLLRGVLSSRGETKAELIRVNESAAEVSVLIKLHIKRQMEQAGLYYIEERTENERLWLALSGGYWNIIRIEPVIAERRPRYGFSEYGDITESIQDDIQQYSPSVQSSPYLNYDLFPQFKHRNAAIPYRRDLAAAYADRWWNQANPAYEEFEVNCTNYISQSIFAGNAPMNYTGKRGSGWWYKGRNGKQEAWSYSWAVSNALAIFLSGKRGSGLRATVIQSAEELQLGDVIIYDWNGDGRFEHSTIVTAFDAAGMPLVNANTVPSRHRYWDYRDSYAWTEQTKYRFFHIEDLL